MMKEKVLNSKIQDIMFKETFFTMLLDQLSCIGAGFIDGLMVSNFLGAEAVAVMGIVAVFYSIQGMFSGLLSVGIRKICIGCLGEGDKEKADQIFNTVFFAALVISFALMGILIAFAGPVASFMGAKGNAEHLKPMAIEYLRGLAIGVPATIFNSVLRPISQVEGKKYNVNVALAAVGIGDVVLDYVSVLLHMGIFGMGLATSLAEYIGFFIVSSFVDLITISIARLTP